MAGLRLKLTHGRRNLISWQASMRFKLIRDGHNEVIRDVEHDINLLFLATSGFGVNSTTRDLAERVVGYLNSLPAEETLLYPFNRKS